MYLKNSGGDITRGDIDLYIGAAKRMCELLYVQLDFNQIVFLVPICKDLFDRFGINVEEADSLEDIFGLVPKQHRDAVAYSLCLLDDIPDGNHKSVRRKRDDKAALVVENMIQDLRRRA